MSAFNTWSKGHQVVDTLNQELGEELVRCVILRRFPSQRKVTAWDVPRRAVGGADVSGIHFLTYQYTFVLYDGPVYRYTEEALSNYKVSDIADDIYGTYKLALSNQLHTHKEKRRRAYEPQ